MMLGSILITMMMGCQKLEDDVIPPPIIPSGIEPLPAPVETPATDPVPFTPTTPVTGYVSESLRDGRTNGVISDGQFTPYGLQLQGGDGFIRYSIPTTPRGFVEFSAAGFRSGENPHGESEFKAVFMTMWSASDGYSYENAPFIFEVRKYGYIEGRSDATNSVSMRIKSRGTWETGAYRILPWNANQQYRFRVEWGGGQATLLRDGQAVATCNYVPEFAPSSHHVQIGAQPLRRKEAPYNLLISDVVIGAQ